MEVELYRVVDPSPATSARTLLNPESIISLSITDRWGDISDLELTYTLPISFSSTRIDLPADANPYWVHVNFSTDASTSIGAYTTFLFRVDSVLIENMESGLARIRVTGRSIDVIFDERPLSELGTPINVTAGLIATKLTSMISKQLVSPDVLNVNNTLGSLGVFGAITEPDSPSTDAFTYGTDGTVWTAMRLLLDQSVLVGYRFSMARDTMYPGSNTWIFEAKNSPDKSSSVVLSESNGCFDNLRAYIDDQDHIVDVIAWCYYPNSSAPTSTITVASNSGYRFGSTATAKNIGISRARLKVDLPDGISYADAQALLLVKAKKYAFERRYKRYVDGKIISERSISQFVYWRDYCLGDRVGIYSQGAGFYKAIVNSVAISYENGRLKVEPTFEVV